ncbi:Ig kappa chain V-II region 17S29.1 [Labeo rohita]|uniref:Ig kappa chain V-II region 17S29.1 n=1 Tax=Labeo rohita TaxID=84645 RepID=A0ABQ8L0V0_LABRO|nr:Ig kappa chain V-II region 17S29.1 [Labeo rohita]
MFIFYLTDFFVCCQAAVANQLIELGQNVSINCDLDENDVYWILQKTPDPPTVILRSMSATPSPFYFNNTFRNKYLLQFKHRLVINNATVDELGVYYCMNTAKQPKFSHSTRLVSTQLTECQNHTVVEFIDQNKTQWQIVSIIFGLLFVVLFLVLIGLLKAFALRNRRSPESPRQLQMQVIEPHQEPDQLQYAEVEFSKLRKKIRSSQVNSTYAALNLPKSRTHEYD